MSRRIYYWKLRTSEIQLGERTLIMGILNVTPDSFSDGGRFSDPDRAYAHALEMEEDGADIIDIGAESTRPGSPRISADEEWQRLVPVLKRLRGNLRVPLSLDTYKSEIAERALEYDVEILNDPSGLTFDPNMAKVAANGNAGLILNHMRGTPETWLKLPPLQDPLRIIAKELEATISRARHAGVDRARIVVDPGLGFGKRKEQNIEILAHLKELSSLDYPILVGPSRKSFLAQPATDQTLQATAAAVTAAILNDAYIVRVHDVKELKSAVQVADEVARAESRPTVVEDEKPARRPKSQTGPTIEADRPRAARAPLSHPAVAPIVLTPKPEEEISAPPPARIIKPAPVKLRDGSLPPVFKRSQDRPAAGTRPRNDRFDSRPPRRDDRPPRFQDRPSRPDNRPPRSDDRTPRFQDRPPRRDDSRPPRFSDRSSRPNNRPPRDDRPPRRDRPDSPGGPVGKFPPRGPARGPSSGPPRGPAPGGGKPGFKPRWRDGDRGGGPAPRDDSKYPKGPAKSGPPPKRPFRKRP